MSTILDITGGSSAVWVLETTGCSIVSSASLLFVVKLELDRNREAVRLPVRCLASGAADAILPRVLP